MPRVNIASSSVEKLIKTVLKRESDDPQLFFFWMISFSNIEISFAFKQQFSVFRCRRVYWKLFYRDWIFFELQAWKVPRNVRISYSISNYSCFITKMFHSKKKKKKNVWPNIDSNYWILKSGILDLFRDLKLWSIHELWILILTFQMSKSFLKFFPHDFFFNVKDNWRVKYFFKLKHFGKC